MSKINNERRSLLQGATLAGVAATMPLTAGAAVKPVLDKLQRDEFPLPDFDSHISELVTIRAQDGQTFSAVIESVEELAFDCAQHRRPGYLRSCAKAVRFRVAGAEALASDIYQVKHASMGKIDLMLTAVPNVKGEYALEAVFN